MKKRSAGVWAVLIVESCLLLFSLFGYASYLILSISGRLPVALQNAAASLNTGELLSPIVIGLIYVAAAIALFQFRNVSIFCFIGALALSILETVAWSFQRQMPVTFQLVWAVQILIIAYAIILRRKGILS